MQHTKDREEKYYKLGGKKGYVRPKLGFHNHTAKKKKKKKEIHVGVLSFPRTRNILVAKTEFITLKNYVFFLLKALVSGTKKCS